MKRILITNDDGILADGLIRLAETASKLGDVWVVAPDGQRSCVSHGLTLNRPFEAWEADFPVPGVRAFACTGTPSDCIRIGVLNLLPSKPDLVLSGINDGCNVIGDIQYSATVGAAFEGIFQGIPSIAVSEESGSLHEVADHYLEEVLTELMGKPLGGQQVWNVNFPGCPLAECRGILRDRKIAYDPYYSDSYQQTAKENGRISFMAVGTKNEVTAEDTDLVAILNRYVSIGVLKNIS